MPTIHHDRQRRDGALIEVQIGPLDASTPWIEKIARSLKFSQSLCDLEKLQRTRSYLTQKLLANLPLPQAMTLQPLTTGDEALSTAGATTVTPGAELDCLPAQDAGSTLPPLPTATPLRPMTLQSAKSMRSFQASTAGPAPTPPMAPSTLSSAPTAAPAIVAVNLTTPWPILHKHDTPAAAQSAKPTVNSLWLDDILSDPAGVLVRTGIEAAATNERAGKRDARVDANVIQIARLADAALQRCRDGGGGKGVDPARVTEMLTEMRGLRILAEGAQATATKGDSDRAAVELTLGAAIQDLEFKLGGVQARVGQLDLGTGTVPFDISNDELFVSVYKVTKAHTESMEQVRAGISNLSTTSATTTTTVRAIQATLAAQGQGGAQGAQVSAQVSSVQADVALAHGRINTSESAVAELRGEITALTAAFAGAENSISSLRSSLSIVQGMLASATPRANIAPLPLISAPHTQAPFFPPEANKNNSSHGFFGDTPSSFKRQRIDGGTGYGAPPLAPLDSIIAVQVGPVLRTGVAVDIVRRIIGLAGLQMSDTAPYSEYVVMDGSTTVVFKIRGLEKARRVIQTVMSGGHSELAGRSARIYEG